MVPTVRKAGLAFIFVTAAIDVMAMGLVIPVLPALVKELAPSDASAGLYNGGFVAVWSLMQLVASPVVGSLSDRFGRRPILLLSAAGLALDYVLMALATNLWWLLVGRIVAGITAASFSTALAYLTDVTPPAGRSRAYGLLGAAFSGGFVAGPLLGGVLGVYGPRTPFWAAAVLSGLSFVYGFFVLPESLAPAQRMPFDWGRANPLGAMRLLLRARELTGLAFVNLLLYFGHHLYSTVFVLYAGDRYGWSTRTIGLLLAGVGALDIVVQGLVVARAVKRWGDRKTMVYGFVFGAAGLVCMGLAPTGTYFVLAMLPAALWGLAMPTLTSLMTAFVGESEQGQLQGAVNSVSSVAGVLAPLLWGMVYSASMGPRAAFPHPGAAFLLAALVLLAAGALGASVSQRKAES